MYNKLRKIIREALMFEAGDSESIPVEYVFIKGEGEREDQYIFKTRSGNQYVLYLKKVKKDDTSKTKFIINEKEFTLFDIIGKKKVVCIVPSFATYEDSIDKKIKSPSNVKTNRGEHIELLGDIVFLLKDYVSNWNTEVIVYSSAGNSSREINQRDMLYNAFVKHQMTDFNVYEKTDAKFTYLIKKSIDKITQ
jgi:hypothetical protein